MSEIARTARAAAIAALALLAAPVLSHAEKKEFKYTVTAGATVAIVNQLGNVTVRAAAGRQVVIQASPASDRVEVDTAQSGNRIIARTHMLQKAAGDEARVDYDVQLPADANISVDSGSGEVRIENMRGSVTVVSEEGQVHVNGAAGGFVQVQSVNSGITLNNVQKSRVQATSTGGAIILNAVAGPSVTAKSTSGAITFTGDFAGGGNYAFSNHSGDINVTMPTSASVDLTARSVNGAVENDFPLQKAAHAAFQMKEGKSLAGVSNSGASSVELKSFSGRIRVKKQ